MTISRIPLHDVTFTISRIGLVWRLHVTCQDCEAPIDQTFAGLVSLTACYEKMTEVIQSYRGHLGIISGITVNT